LLGPRRPKIWTPPMTEFPGPPDHGVWVFCLVPPQVPDGRTRRRRCRKRAPPLAGTRHKGLLQGDRPTVPRVPGVGLLSPISAGLQRGIPRLSTRPC
jgi:hypothetical protein